MFPTYDQAANFRCVSLLQNIQSHSPACSQNFKHFGWWVAAKTLRNWRNAQKKCLSHTYVTLSLLEHFRAKNAQIFAQKKVRFNKCNSLRHTDQAAKIDLWGCCKTSILVRKKILQNDQSCGCYRQKCGELQNSKISAEKIIRRANLLN